jgi:hypothetical protein
MCWSGCEGFPTSLFGEHRGHAAAPQTCEPALSIKASALRRLVPHSDRRLFAIALGLRNVAGIHAMTPSE